MAGTFDAWLSSLGPLTRVTLFLTVALAAVSSFGIVSPSYFILTNETWRSFQLWRPFTSALFFGNFSFPWLMSVGMLVTYMNYNETIDFKNLPGNFVWFLLWIVVMESIAGILLGFRVTSFSLCTSLCWTFCRRNAAQPVNLFGFTFSAGMFPWALTGLHVLMGQSMLPDLVGILVGHAALFLFDVLPSAHPVWRTLSRTPRWVHKLFGTAPPSQGRAAPHPEIHPDLNWRTGGANAAAPNSYNWGSGGKKLGAS